MRLLAEPANPSLGQTVAITVEVDAVNGSVGGFYFKLEGGGSLQVPANSGIRTFTAGQLGHSAPKTATGGVVRFTFNWTTPDQPGGAVLRAWGVSANGNDASSGDGAAQASDLLIAYGCAGELYAYDPDGDGFGDAELGQMRNCSVPAGYAKRDGDCAEYDPAIHPDAAELCNGKDDDCDGKNDEQLPLGPQYPDLDGDGHGDSASASSKVDCSSPKGFAANHDDCNDSKPTVHPDATETCDYIDEDCDGRMDEGARADCGVGWCRQLADSCNAALCTPGKPRSEECNAFDDDCDDMIDEDVSCGAGERCVEGRCLTAAEAEAQAQAGPDGGAAMPAGNDDPSASGAAGPAPNAHDGSGESGAAEDDDCPAGAGAKNAACAQEPASAGPAKGGCTAALDAGGARTSWLATAWALLCLLARRRGR